MTLPYELHYDITNRCNLKCPQCARTNRVTGKTVDHNSPKRELTLEDFKKCNPEHMVKNLKHALFCGNYGDPIISEHLLGMLEYLWKINNKISVKVHSNCSLRLPAYWQKLAELTKDKKFLLVASVDGASQNTLSQYRIGAKYDKIIENIKTFIKFGGKAEWRFIVFKHNQHEIKLAEKIATDIGCVGFKYYNSSRYFGDDGVFKHFNGVLEKPDYTVDNKFKDKKTIPFEDVLETKSVISCESLNRRTLFLDFMGNLSPCCHVGIRLYNNITKSRDANGDQGIQDIITEFGNDKFNATKLGFNAALFNCLDFLDVLEEHWKEQKPFVCKMICGKKIIKK